MRLSHSFLRGTVVLLLCGMLSGCGVFYGAMCGGMAIFTPSELVTKIRHRMRWPVSRMSKRLKSPGTQE